MPPQNWCPNEVLRNCHIAIRRAGIRLDRNRTEEGSLRCEYALPNDWVLPDREKPAVLELISDLPSPSSGMFHAYSFLPIGSEELMRSIYLILFASGGLGPRKGACPGRDWFLYRCPYDLAMDWPNRLPHRGLGMTTEFTQLTGNNIDTNEFPAGRLRKGRAYLDVRSGPCLDPEDGELHWFVALMLPRGVFLGKHKRLLSEVTKHIDALELERVHFLIL